VELNGLNLNCLIGLSHFDDFARLLVTAASITPY
jgi:hypothetical protein